MALRELLLPWSAQPQEAVSVNPEHPLAARLISAFIGGSVCDAFGRPASSNGATRGISVDGLTWATNGSSTRIYIDFPRRTISEFTLFAITTPTSVVTDATVISLGQVGASNPTIPLRAGNTTAARLQKWVRGNGGGTITGSRDTTTTAFVAGQRVAVGLSGSLLGGIQAYINGALDATSTSVNDGSWTVDRFAIGTLWANSDNNFGAYGSSVMLAFDAALTDNWHRELAANPWQLFEPRRIFVPVSAGGGGQSIAVPAGALSLAGYAPTVAATGNQVVPVPSGALSLTAFAPTIAATANQTLAVPAGSLSLTGYAPTVNVSAANTIAVPSGTLSLTAYAPTVVAPATLTIPAASLTLTGYAPSVNVAADKTIQIPSGTLTLTGYAPALSITGLIAVASGALTLTGYAPTVLTGEQVEERRGGHAFMRERFAQARKRLALQRILSYLTEEEPAEETKRIIRAVKAGKPVEDKKPPVVMAEVSAEKIADKLIPSRVSDLAEIPDIDMQAVIKKAIRLAQERDDEDVLLLL